MALAAHASLTHRHIYYPVLSRARSAGGRQDSPVQRAHQTSNQQPRCRLAHPAVRSNAGEKTGDARADSAVVCPQHPTAVGSGVAASPDNKTAGWLARIRFFKVLRREVPTHRDGANPRVSTRFDCFDNESGAGWRSFAGEPLHHGARSWCPIAPQAGAAAAKQCRKERSR